MTVSAFALGGTLAGCGVAAETPAPTIRPAAATSTMTQPAKRPAVAPLRVLATSPRGTVPGDRPIQIRFSAPMRSPNPHRVPRLSPAIRGTWTQTTPATLTFTPSGAYAPGTVVSVSVPAGFSDAAGATLRHSVRFSFRVGAASPVRLVQLLAQQGYLPLSFRPAHPVRGAASAQRALYQPPEGTLEFDRGWPAALHGLWAHRRTLMVSAAVRAFEAAHSLTMDGIAGPQVWGALLRAELAGQRSPFGYSYAIASEASPETLTVWHDGRQVLRSLANTGVAGASTAPGSYPVYERLRSQIMRGTNLNGSHYADPVSWVAYFNGGDAVHYFNRASYGYPQSLGCVELPYAAAEKAWGYLSYGTLVTVQAP